MLNFKSFDFGVRNQLNYEYLISCFILNANIGFDFVFDRTSLFKDDKEAQMIN
jgi:hypothetical protein